MTFFPSTNAFTRGEHWVEFLDNYGAPIEFYDWRDCQNDAAREVPEAVDMWRDFVVFEAFKRITR